MTAADVAAPRPVAVAGEQVAAVDLGSNSFHMVIARVTEAGDLVFLDRIREQVQLAAGLDATGRLTDAAQTSALECLSRFGQRLRDIPPHRVRVVGTNTLRAAKNAREFSARAERALGHEIEVVPGREEARLIYLGVVHSLPADGARRLVIDVGGGSTECIIGEGFEPRETESLYMGAVGYSRRYFPDGELRREFVRQAVIAARLELQTIERHYRAIGWDTCVGSSGTVLAIEEILRATGWSERGITRGGLKKLRKALVQAGDVRNLALPGLRPDRAPIIAGGLAILLATFDSLGVKRMTTATGALREGALYDLLGRIRHEDVRDRTIRFFSERYKVDVQQAARVERTALGLLRQVAADWELDEPESRQFLSWAARLHEVGLAISHSGYHKHGAYILQNSDMPGFSLQDRQLVAALVRWHRRRFSRDGFTALPPAWIETTEGLCVLLRLAVVLNRSRSRKQLPALALGAQKRRLELRFPPGWIEEHPLTRADVAEEAKLLGAAGYQLKLVDGS